MIKRARFLPRSRNWLALLNGRGIPPEPPCPSDEGTALIDEKGAMLVDENGNALIEQLSLRIAPGPQELIAGDLDNGFFGELLSTELFTNAELDALLGFTEGEPTPDAGWLKFARNGNIIYVQKRPMRVSISWDHIYSRGCVYGTDNDGLFPTGTPTNQYRPIERNGLMFIPRLLTGAVSDPVDATNRVEDDSCIYDLGGGSEWNELIYRVHQDEPFCSDPDYDTLHGGPQMGDNWAAYTNGDLGIVSGAGRATWTQEQSSDLDSARITRGFRDFNPTVAHFSRIFSSTTNSRIGLRLVLELKSNSC